MSSLKEIIIRTPKNIFLLDGLGAILSSFVIGVVLVYFHGYIGLSKNQLYVLAIIPLGILCVDIFSFYGSESKIPHNVRLVSLLNIGYCFFSLFILVSHFSEITRLGLTYFALEIIVVMFIAVMEWRCSLIISESKKYES